MLLHGVQTGRSWGIFPLGFHCWLAAIVGAVSTPARWNAESEQKTANNTNYVYDGDGNRLYKATGTTPTKIYWYGAGTEILDESDGSGNITNEYAFFGGKRVAMDNITGTGGGSIGSTYYYAEDFLGSSRTMVQAGGTSACFDADFLPFGREKDNVATCTQNDYKFEGKERDSETGNDDFGARYYSSNFGRWLSPDWSSIPEPVPYANLTNPQTLNLYAMVQDNPESFADLDGHFNTPGSASQTVTCNVTDGQGCDEWELGYIFNLNIESGNRGQTGRSLIFSCAMERRKRAEDRQQHKLRLRRRRQSPLQSHGYDAHKDLLVWRRYRDPRRIRRQW